MPQLMLSHPEFLVNGRLRGEEVMRRTERVPCGSSIPLEARNPDEPKGGYIKLGRSTQRLTRL